MGIARAKIERLIQGALGEIKADLILTGGRLVNVYSGEVLDGMEVAVLDGRICYVGPSAGHTRGDSTEILDCRDLYVAPGFIDGHTHIGHFCRPFEFLQAYLPHGTTALMTSCDEHSAVFGYDGACMFLDEVEVHPVRVYTLVPMVAPQDPLLCRTRSLSQAEVARCLADPRVLGLGEVVSWLRLIQRDPEVLERIEMTLEAGKIIHGHTAGARDRKLAAIAAAGVSSCHEPVGESEVLEKLRAGYWVMLREGSFRQDMEGTLGPIIKRGLNTQRVMLVTDGMAPDDVQDRGHMDYLVRRAVEIGLPPVKAIQAVTLTPAIYSGLETDIGGIAPGRCADFTLLEDLERVRVEATYIGGLRFAQQGKSLVQGGAIPLSASVLSSPGLKAQVSENDLRVSALPAGARARVIELVNHTITREAFLELPAANGAVEAVPDRDILKVAVFDRRGESGSVAIGFLKGWGARVGAVGTTVNLDEYALLVVGSNDSDMARCANVLLEDGGGLAIVDKGVVLEKMGFPVGGIFTLDPWQKVAGDLRRIQRCLREKGSPFERPFYPLFFLTFVTLPALRITNRGLVRAKDRCLVPLWARES